MKWFVCPKCDEVVVDVVRSMTKNKKTGGAVEKQSMSSCTEPKPCAPVVAEVENYHRDRGIVGGLAQVVEAVPIAMEVVAGDANATGMM